MATTGETVSDALRFATQAEAKAFFIDRIIAQSSSEFVVLSPAERHVLSWSESDPSQPPDFDLAAEFDRQTTGEDFEMKIAGLLRNAYAADVRERSSAKMAYRAAYAKLREGDHYLLVMIDRALGIWVKPWWPF